MDMAAILVNGAEPFEQIGNTVVKIPQAVSEKKTFKNYTLCTCI